MCAICRKEPCDSRCPNAPEPQPVTICIGCEEGIYPGEKYLDLPEGAICEECVGAMNGRELLEYLGQELCEAHESDF